MTAGPLTAKEGHVPTCLDRLARFAVEFDERLRALLGPVADDPSLLAQAMRTSLLGAGKRIRPFVTVECCSLVGGERDGAWPVAGAVECVHAFSLVHDDLPAMDNDDFRRGVPTCHRRFGEATAILAGDGLLALAFELVGHHVQDPPLAAGIMSELARTAGWSGLIGGQAAEISAEGQSPSLDLVRRIHLGKTGRLFEAACRLGAMVGGAKDSDGEALSRFGRHLGCAFQITDDLLDATSTGEGPGKDVRKAGSGGKPTYVQCVGVEESRSAARRSAEQAVAELSRFGSAADGLRDLTGMVLVRNR